MKLKKRHSLLIQTQKKRKDIVINKKCQSFFLLIGNIFWLFVIKYELNIVAETVSDILCGITGFLIKAVEWLSYQKDCYSVSTQHRVCVFSSSKSSPFYFRNLLFFLGTVKSKIIKICKCMDILQGFFFSKKSLKVELSIQIVCLR